MTRPYPQPEVQEVIRDLLAYTRHHGTCGRNHGERDCGSYHPPFCHLSTLSKRAEALLEPVCGCFCHEPGAAYPHPSHPDGCPCVTPAANGPSQAGDQ